MDGERNGTAWYFAYGSNADRGRLERRVGEVAGAKPARLEGWQLAFSSRVRSEGGGGAIVVRQPGAVVHGVAYRLTHEQLRALDAAEFDPSRDVHGTGRRIAVRVATPDGRHDATMYTIEADQGRLGPSERYLGYILNGLAEAGHGEPVLEDVRAAAARDTGATQ